MGGSTPGENMSVLSSVERLDPKFNTWEIVTSLSPGMDSSHLIKNVCEDSHRTVFTDIYI